MKKHLLFSVSLFLFLALSSFAQEYEFWGIKAYYIFKTDGNCENYQVVYEFEGHDGYAVAVSRSLILASNGKLYGMTNHGNKGTNYMGTIFEYDREKKLCTIKVDFDGTNGKNPEGSLIQATNGKLYGMTKNGGKKDRGVLFEYDIEKDTLIKLLDFTGNDGLYRGAHPTTTLLQADNGKLYGVTPTGTGGGVLFMYDITDSAYTVIRNFDAFSDKLGNSPWGSLMQADNGKIYGTTSRGGSHNTGTLFELDPSDNTMRRLFTFDGTDHGGNGGNALIQASDGLLYGLCNSGGTYGEGTLYTYDITNNIFVKHLDFSGDEAGAYPEGSLMEASNGKMYGTTCLGSCSYGSLFEYDPVADTVIEKVCGGSPHGNLIEIEAICEETADTITEASCYSYTSPSGKYTWTISGTYTDTIPNTDGCDSIIAINLTINTVDVSVTQDGITLTAGASGASYQWLDCDNGYKPLNGDTSRVFTATVSGNYAVAVTMGSCTDTSECYDVIAQEIIENDSDKQIKIYPNPSKGNTTVETGSLRNVSISLFDIAGRKVYSIENVTNTKTVLPTCDLKAGVYIVKIQSFGHIKIIKLVKQ